MTVHAREVLKDCELLLPEISKDLWGPNWRLRWGGLLALLRAVGHVLAKVDSKESAEAKRAIGEAWNALNVTRPEPKIFWEFIEAERNNILKAYEFGAGVNLTVRPGHAIFNSETGEQVGVAGLQSTFNAFMRSGEFVDRDPLELCQDAIKFWHAYLNEVDRKIASPWEKSMTDNESQISCSHCQAALPKDHTGKCPNCGKTGRSIQVGIAEEVDTAASLRWEKIRKSYKWRIGILTTALGLTVLSSLVGLWLKEWTGVIVSLAIGLVAFVVGIRTITETIEKEHGP